MFLKQHEDVLQLDTVVESIQDLMLLDVKILLRYDPQFSKPVNSAIENPEEITLRYAVLAKRTAPRVLAVRKDFPDDLPHLNLRSGENNEKSLCLWGSGTRDLYEHHGIARLLQVLQDWLADARDGVLSKGEWEPAPYEKQFLVHCNIGKLQKKADQFLGDIRKGKCALWKEGRYFGVGRITKYPTNAASLNVKRLDAKERQKRKEAMGRYEHSCYLITSEARVTFSNPLRTIPTSLDELISLLPQENTRKFCDFVKKRNFEERGGLLVVFSLRRPLPMQSEVVGVATTTSSHNELLAFWIYSENGEMLIEQVGLISDASKELLAAVSGEKKYYLPVNIVGCGSVGSALAVLLARSGITISRLVDPDFLLPHNNTRHECETGGKVPYLLLKARVLAEKIQNISSDYSPECTYDVLNARNFDELGSGHVIETIGSNDLESLWLSKPETPVHRILISGSGRVALLQSQNMSHDLSNASLLDIEAQMYLLALHVDKIREWLLSDGVLSNRLLGFGCSSATMEMPWSTIQNHCSSLFPAVKEALNSKISGLIFNFLTEDGKPDGYLKCDLPKFKEISCFDEMQSDWTVRLSESVEKFLFDERVESRPNEVGGFLIGLVNLEEHCISVCAATRAVKRSSPSEVELISADEDPALINILEASGYKLGLLGTWHSHVLGTSKPSFVDFETLSDTAQSSVVGPSVMVIVAENDLTVEVRTPVKWKELG
jgi:proteasome lid subunit RPN8/RPN11